MKLSMKSVVFLVASVPCVAHAGLTQTQQWYSIPAGSTLVNYTIGTTNGQNNTSPSTCGVMGERGYFQEGLSDEISFEEHANNYLIQLSEGNAADVIQMEAGCAPNTNWTGAIGSGPVFQGVSIAVLAQNGQKQAELWNNPQHPASLCMMSGVGGYIPSYSQGAQVTTLSGLWFVGAAAATGNPPQNEVWASGWCFDFPGGGIPTIVQKSVADDQNHDNVCDVGNNLNNICTDMGYTFGNAFCFLQGIEGELIAGAPAGLSAVYLYEPPGKNVQLVSEAANQTLTQHEVGFAACVPYAIP
jgi:hypothetical protein